MLIYTDCMTRHTGLLQILFLGSCLLLIDWKIPLISLARYAICGQSDMETKSSFRYSFFRICFQINYHSLEKYAIFFYRHGTIDYFVTVQIPSFGTDCRLWWWGVRGHGWDDTVDHQLCSCTVFDDTEFASRSGAEQCGSYQWAITCSISVESFCIWWHSDVAKMCMAPKKCTIYTKFGNECDPWVSVSLHKLVISYFYLIN